MPRAAPRLQGGFSFLRKCKRQSGFAFFFSSPGETGDCHDSVAWPYPYVTYQSSPSTTAMRAPQRHNTKIATADTAAIRGVTLPRSSNPDGSDLVIFSGLSFQGIAEERWRCRRVRRRQKYVLYLLGGWTGPSDGYEYSDKGPFSRSRTPSSGCSQQGVGLFGRKSICCELRRSRT